MELTFENKLDKQKKIQRKKLNPRKQYVLLDINKLGRALEKGRINSERKSQLTLTKLFRIEMKGVKKRS